MSNEKFLEVISYKTEQLSQNGKMFQKRKKLGTFPKWAFSRLFLLCHLVVVVPQPRFILVQRWTDRVHRPKIIVCSSIC